MRENPPNNGVETNGFKDRLQAWVSCQSEKMSTFAGPNASPGLQVKGSQYGFK